MMISRWSLILILLTFGVCACSDDSDDSDTPITPQLNRVEATETWAEHWLPAQLDSAKSATIRLQEVVDSYAASGDPNDLTVAREAWTRAALAWSSIELSNIGDARFTFLYARMHQWPVDADRLETYIDDNEASDFAELLPNAPASIIGLSALEYLLFSQETVQDQHMFLQQPKYTSFLQALSMHQRDNQDEIHKFWIEDGYAMDIALNDGSGVNESFNMLYNSMMFELEVLKNRELGQALGKQTGDQGAALLRAYRSGQSGASYLAKLEAIYASYTGLERIGYDDLLRQQTAGTPNAQLADEVNALFQQALASARNAQQPWSAGVDQNDPQLEDTYQHISDLVILFRSDIASSLSVTIVFSDTDGD